MTLQTIIHLTNCPNCNRPLAAVYPHGGDGVGYFIQIDGVTIDLSQTALIWCDKCEIVLPVPLRQNDDPGQSTITR